MSKGLGFRSSGLCAVYGSGFRDEGSGVKVEARAVPARPQEGSASTRARMRADAASLTLPVGRYISSRLHHYSQASALTSMDTPEVRRHLHDHDQNPTP